MKKPTCIQQRIIKENELKGYFVALAIDGKVYFGYSMCDDEDKNKPNMKERAFGIAFNRAAQKKEINNIPSSIKSEFCLFFDRAHRYFKEYELIDMTKFSDNSIYRAHEKGFYHEGLLDVADMLKEKLRQKKQAAVLEDLENCYNVSYWLKKASKCASNKNLAGLHKALNYIEANKEMK
jgi:hypothetical protein